MEKGTRNIPSLLAVNYYTTDARIHGLAESIPGLLKRLQIRAQNRTLLDKLVFAHNANKLAGLPI
jgi:hypothetical protein